jgi:hypothetical protein
MGLATPKMGMTIPENGDGYPCFWALKKLKEKRKRKKNKRGPEPIAQRGAQREATPSTYLYCSLPFSSSPLVSKEGKGGSSLFYGHRKTLSPPQHKYCN